MYLQWVLQIPEMKTEECNINPFYSYSNLG